MSEVIALKSAGRNLEKLIEGLSLGESITLIGPEGCPVALLVSLNPGTIVKKPDVDWDARMDDLARKVSRAWKGERSAVALLSEMRR